MVFAFSPLKVSWSISTLLLNSGISCTSTTSSFTSATVSRLCGMLSSGRSAITCSNFRSSGKLSETCPTDISIPVFFEA